MVEVVESFLHFTPASDDSDSDSIPEMGSIISQARDSERREQSGDCINI
jgi:hypothetical protein